MTQYVTILGVGCNTIHVDSNNSFEPTYTIYFGLAYTIISINSNSLSRHSYGIDKQMSLSVKSFIVLIGTGQKQQSRGAQALCIT